MVIDAPRHYVSAEEDSARWARLRPRDGDIVVSTRSKHGTTWVQTILLLLLHGDGALAAPLPVVSPWLDHLVEPIDAVIDRLEAQDHPRIIKTHTPLDGLPLHPQVQHIVVARAPLDAAVSLYHQGDNLDRDRIRQLTGRTAHVRTTQEARPGIAAWLSRWVHDQPEASTSLDSLPGVLHHLADAWARRHAPNVHLIHYADLLADLDGQMRSLAEVAGVTPGDGWERLVAAARFTAMRDRADVLAPDAGGVLRDRRAFFRAGRSGAGSAALSAADLEAYRRRVRAALPADLVRWLHR